MNPQKTHLENGRVVMSKPANSKKQIEEKQERLNRFVNQGRLGQAEANQQVRQFARRVCRYHGE